MNDSVIYANDNLGALVQVVVPSILIFKLFCIKHDTELEAFTKTVFFSNNCDIINLFKIIIF